MRWTFLDSAEATVDLFVSSPPTGDDDAFFKLRGLNGEKVAFAIEGIGWRQGSSSFGTGLPQLPNGVAVFFGPVRIIIQEIGLLAEQGATYLSITAGVDTPLPKQLRGSVVLKRARFQIKGLADAPRFLLDGFFVSLKSSKVRIEAGGFFTDKTEGDVRVREFGLSGSVHFVCGKTSHGLSLDLLIGSISSPAERFRYFMAQAFYRSILLASFELRGMRLLFANNLQPKLQPADAAAGELRYFNWYRQTNPLFVPGDRRVSGWKPEDGAWTFGIGCGASLPALGKVCELNVFVLVVDGDDESGGLFAGELTALSNPKPLGFFAVEADNKTDRVSMVIGVDVKLPDFLKDPPEWSRNVGTLTGTLFIGNKPCTFALGRLADQRTWLTLQFDIDFFLKSTFKFAFCFETTSGGPSGVGFIVSVEGGIKCGSKFQLTYIARFALSAGSFTTGSSDGAATISIELAGPRGAVPHHQARAQPAGGAALCRLQAGAHRGNAALPVRDAVVPAGFHLDAGHDLRPVRPRRAGDGSMSAARGGGDRRSGPREHAAASGPIRPERSRLRPQLGRQRDSADVLRPPVRRPGYAGSDTPRPLRGRRDRAADRHRQHHRGRLERRRQRSAFARRRGRHRSWHAVVRRTRPHLRSGRDQGPPPQAVRRQPSLARSRADRRARRRLLRSERHRPRRRVSGRRR